MTLYWSHNSQKPKDWSCIQNCLNITEPTSSSHEALWQELIPNCARELQKQCWRPSQRCRPGVWWRENSPCLWHLENTQLRCSDKETSEKQGEWSEGSKISRHNKKQLTERSKDVEMGWRQRLARAGLGNITLLSQVSLPITQKALNLKTHWNNF